MRQALIESWIDALRASFGSAKAPLAEEELRTLYDARDYAGMVLYIQNVLRLDMKVLLGLVNKGGPDAPAWVRLPSIMPLYGTSAFRQTTIVFHLRKSFLHKGNFETTVLAIAHELCHVLLDATWHPLRRQEEAVDLTAMLLGFRDFYVTGCQSSVALDADSYRLTHTGYLTPEEVGHAAIYMTFR
jgi:hypothetical protein